MHVGLLVVRKVAVEAKATGPKSVELMPLALSVKLCIYMTRLPRHDFAEIVCQWVNPLRQRTGLARDNLVKSSQVSRANKCVNNVGPIAHWLERGYDKPEVASSILAGTSHLFTSITYTRLVLSCQSKSHHGVCLTIMLV